MNEYIVIIKYEFILLLDNNCNILFYYRIIMISLLQMHTVVTVNSLFLNTTLK